jgi:putative molybdopterin biosynthesis protein
MEVQSKLALVRQRRGISAAKLADAVGVSRQTIYAIEAGSYVPNTSVALKLSRVLDVTVEELFLLEDDSSSPPVTEEVELLTGDDDAVAGQSLQLCKVNNRLVAAAPEPGTWSLPQGDAVLLKSTRELKSRKAKAQAQVLEPDWEANSRILIAGCDPAAAVLARHLQRQGIDLIISFQNSSRALELLKRGVVHIAGTHLWSESTGASNLPLIDKTFSKDSVAVLSFALWEEGFVLAPGNPKTILSAADLARPNVSIANREAGAGCRSLLDTLLHRLGIKATEVKGYERIAPGHLPAARLVLTGEADCCISTRAAARVFGLDFVPLMTKRYDLVVRKNSLKLPHIQTLAETLGRASFRRSLEAFAGYDMKASGDRVI